MRKKEGKKGALRPSREGKKAYDNALPGERERTSTILWQHFGQGKKKDNVYKQRRKEKHGPSKVAKGTSPFLLIPFLKRGRSRPPIPFWKKRGGGALGWDGTKGGRGNWPLRVRCIEESHGDGWVVFLWMAVE